MKHKAAKIIHLLLTLVMFAAMLGFASSVSAATTNLWAWGQNTYGQLGDGTATDRLTPVRVSGLTGVVAIAGGRFHSLAIQSPDAPSMVEAKPANGEKDVPSNTAISWVAVPFVNYDFQLSTNANFTTLTANVTNSSSTTYTPAAALATNNTFYWRVRSRAMTLTSAWVTGTFTTVSPTPTAPPPAPLPAAPPASPPTTTPPPPTSPTPTSTPPTPTPVSSTPWVTIITSIIAAVLATTITALIFIRVMKRQKA